MRGVPRSPYKDGKYNEGSHDNGECSAANRAFPILTITHSVLPTDIDGERGCPPDGSPFSIASVHENMIRKRPGFPSGQTQSVCPEIMLKQ
jgi:hypothetical protein